MKLGLVIPCRDEAPVVGRKLANLARCAWPGEGVPHRVVVVDDGSSDGTAEAARAAAADAFRGEAARVEVIASENAGKAAAVAAGLAALAAPAAKDPGGAGPAELVGITDADVVLRPDALVELDRAFARDPRLAMACGAQEFVRDLAADGACRAADGGTLRPAAGLYDRWTARVRRLESRAGRLFSVHGQLLAWRAELGLRPTPGVAADDIDLMLQVRARRDEPRRVRLLRSARFLEVKTPPGPDGEDQALRRARAYFQVTTLARAPLPRLADRLQLGLYRWGPRLAPALAPLAAGVGVLVPTGRRLARLLDVIARARTPDPAAAVSDRWEMRRT